MTPKPPIYIYLSHPQNVMFWLFHILNWKVGLHMLIKVLKMFTWDSGVILSQTDFLTVVWPSHLNRTQAMSQKGRLLTEHWLGTFSILIVRYGSRNTITIQKAQYYSSIQNEVVYYQPESGINITTCNDEDQIVVKTLLPAPLTTNPPYQTIVKVLLPAPLTTVTSLRILIAVMPPDQMTIPWRLIVDIGNFPF